MCTPVTSECALPYVHAENICTTDSCSALKENTSHPILCVSYCKLHLEVYILCFATENSLLLLFTPKLIQFLHPEILESCTSWK